MALLEQGMTGAKSHRKRLLLRLEIRFSWVWVVFLDQNTRLRCLCNHEGQLAHDMTLHAVASSATGRLQAAALRATQSFQQVQEATQGQFT